MSDPGQLFGALLLLVLWPGVYLWAVAFIEC